MKQSRFWTLTGIFAVGFLCLSLSQANAQGPLYDKVTVDLPYAVMVNNTTLQPGHYVIRQFDDQGGGSRVLQIFSDSGMKLETTAVTIPTIDNNTPEKTSVVLHHFGNGYFFDKVWVQGKNYGYEFPLPTSVKGRENERMQPYTVAAQYEAPSQPQLEVAQNTAPPIPAPAPVAVEAPAPSAPAPMATPEPAAVPEPQPPSETNSMPTTADGWVLQIAAGFLLIGTGFLLRRRLA